MRSRFRSIDFALAALILSVAVVALLIAYGNAGSRKIDATSSRIRSLVILPLTNLSRDADQEYFVDGMTEALITELAKIPSLTVISRTSVMQYKGKSKPLGDIARELNVEGVVEGAVIRSGGRVRITAQLIDARSDRHLWAETYDRDLEDVLALQGEIGCAVAGAVRVTLRPQAQKEQTSTRSVSERARSRAHFSQALREIGLVYEQKGMFPQSIAVLQEALRASGNYFTATTTADLGHVYAVSDRERDARKILGELHALSDKRYVSAFDVAVIYAGLGDTAQALSWLQKAYDDRSFFLVSLNVDPRFDDLRAEPRFRALMDRLGLPVPKSNQ